ncbi:hypothetical protein [Ammoniphilus sp. 3BR4]|uniref:hypothetical protein n=1 Tax=Ammoniphilus sp. 3BR4 TaxID=3158265 RepID=UPI0034679A48
MFHLTLDELRDGDLAMDVRGVCVLLDPYSKRFIFKTLHIDYATESGFVLVDR